MVTSQCHTRWNSTAMLPTQMSGDTPAWSHRNAIQGGTLQRCFRPKCLVIRQHGHIGKPSRGDIYLISILYIHSLFYIYVHLCYTYTLFLVVIVMLCCTRDHRPHIQMVRAHYRDMLQRCHVRGAISKSSHVICRPYLFLLSHSFSERVRR